MIIQDEKETQIQVIMHGTDVAHYANEFVPFQTYLLLGAFVSESIKEYGIPLHQFSWTIDKGTIVEPIDKVIPPEPPLLPPTLLKTTSFDSFDYQTIGFEVDILALVINGSPPSYASNGNRIQEFIIIDYESDEIKSVLNTYTTKSTTAIGSLLFVPFEEHIVPIVNIQQQSLEQVFHVQAQLLISNETQKFCVLVFSDYKKVFPRIWTQRTFYCTTCRRPTQLTPRCQFEVTIKDDTGSTTTMISDKIGEELLSLTVAEIQDIRCIKKQLLFAKNKDASSAKLFIMSITEKDIASNLPLPINAPRTPESSKRKLKQIMIKED
uniref:Replication factor A C-terminal domain-containing protein n=1 Tax=Solanum lycopersicum TaxID=4081 RepID=A0A3Q7HNJ5_SOLLC